MTELPIRARGGLAIAWYPHHVEHLAPWCEIMGVPMLLADSPGLFAATRCYPGLDVAWAHGVRMPAGRDPFARAIRERRPGVVYCSDLFDRPVLRDMLGGGGDAPRVVYVPHGFSEKRQDWARATALQDVAVLYGRHAFDQLDAWGVAGELHRYLLSGNVRRAYYRRHAAWFEGELDRLGIAGDHPGRTLLYAPTWNDAIGSSSFFGAFAAIARRIPADWRLVVKLHPHSERFAATIDEIVHLCRGRDLHVVRNSPLTFPLLDLADAYVGDMSSLAYDYLACGRPMFFTNPTSGTSRDAAGSRLFACGTTIAPERYDDVWRIVDDAWPTDAGRYGEARAALDRYTHAPERSVDDLRAEMSDLTRGPPPPWMAEPPARRSDADVGQRS